MEVLIILAHWDNGRSSAEDWFILIMFLIILVVIVAIITATAWLFNFLLKRFLKWLFKNKDD